MPFTVYGLIISILMAVVTSDDRYEMEMAKTMKAHIQDELLHLPHEQTTGN